MYLYLVRHGEAVQADTADPSMALTPKGILGAEKVAAHLASLNIKIDLLVHSTKARAKQTAGIFASRLHPSKAVSENGDLGPHSDPLIWAGNLDLLNENVMLVGHMPFMSRMVSLLSCGLGDESAFAFDNAAVACLGRDYGKWSLLWMISPAVIRGERQA